MQALLPQLITRPALPELPVTKRLLALDASDIRAPGTSGIWRLHALLDVVTLQLAGVQLTDVKTGETLCNFTFQAGEVVLTDRGYSHRRGVAQVVDSGGAVLTRDNPHQIPLVDAQRQALESAAWLATCERGETRTRHGFFTAPEGRLQEVWIHASRLPQEAAARARRRCRRAGATGKDTPTAVTLWLAQFVLVWSTVPPEELSAAVVLAL